VAKLKAEWQSLTETGGRAAGRLPSWLADCALQSSGGPGEDLAGKTKGLKKDGDMFSGDLTEEGAKDLASFGGRREAAARRPA